MSSRDKSYQWSKIPTLGSGTRSIIYPIVQIQTVSSVPISSFSSHATCSHPARTIWAFLLPRPLLKFKSPSSLRWSIGIAKKLSYFLPFLFFNPFFKQLQGCFPKHRSYHSPGWNTVVSCQCLIMQLEFYTMSSLTPIYYFSHFISHHSLTGFLGSGHVYSSGFWNIPSPTLIDFIRISAQMPLTKRHLLWLLWKVLTKPIWSFIIIKSFLGKYLEEVKGQSFFLSHNLATRKQASLSINFGTTFIIKEHKISHKTCPTSSKSQLSIPLGIWKLIFACLPIFPSRLNDTTGGPHKFHFVWFISILSSPRLLAQCFV